MANGTHRTIEVSIPHEVIPLMNRTDGGMTGREDGGGYCIWQRAYEWQGQERKEEFHQIGELIESVLRSLLVYDSENGTTWRDCCLMLLCVLACSR